jgi:hypothetical protein
VLNSFARMHVRDEELFKRFAQYACNLPAGQFSAQNVANIVNAVAKVYPHSTQSTPNIHNYASDLDRVEKLRARLQDICGLSPLRLNFNP